MDDCIIVHGTDRSRDVVPTTKTGGHKNRKRIPKKIIEKILIVIN